MMLEIRGLCKRFGDREVLRGLDLSVPENSIFGFVGKNGAGKTTTMKTVLGLLAADEGEIFVNGERVVYGETATNRHVGYLPDVPEFYTFMTAREYLRFCGEITGMSGAEIRARSEELLRLVGLDGETHRIKGFSRGMKQRLGIAQALLGRPKLLICDEPTSALDPTGRKEILDTLQAVRQETTVLFSTHILSDVERIATDVAFLDGGAVTVSGKLADVKTRFRGDEYLLETETPEARDGLRSAFPTLRSAGENRLLASGEEIYAVMGFAADRHLPLIKLERVEPTLETLFMEVIGK